MDVREVVIVVGVDVTCVVVVVAMLLFVSCVLVRVFS